MHQFFIKSLKVSWGASASVAIHLLLAILLFYTPVWRSVSETDQDIAVQLVPPAIQKPAPQEKQMPKVPTPEAPMPQAFESASKEKAEESSEPEPSVTEAASHVAKPPESRENILEPNATGNSQAQGSETTMPLTSATTGSAAHNTQRGQLPPSSEGKPAAAKASDKLERARKIYSKDALSNPRVKQALGKLPSRDRMVQICGIEALEQVRNHRSGSFPDMLAPEGGISGQNSFTIRDGAFRSKGTWYSIDFRCQVDDDAMEIKDFSYAIGKAIPRAEWKLRQLPTD